MNQRSKRLSSTAESGTVGVQSNKSATTTETPDRGASISENAGSERPGTSGPMQLNTITVRTASRCQIGNGFQEVGVSLSYVLGPEVQILEDVVALASSSLVVAFAALWRQMDMEANEV